MKRFLIFIICVGILIAGVSFATDGLDLAYQKASKEAGSTTALLVESIDLNEFADYYDLNLTDSDKQLIRIALMSYSNGAMLEHPVGMNNTHRATILQDPYVGNKKTEKYHYPWCSSVSDIKESNKILFESREDAEKAGFTPCKRCNP